MTRQCGLGVVALAWSVAWVGCVGGGGNGVAPVGPMPADGGLFVGRGDGGPAVGRTDAARSDAAQLATDAGRPDAAVPGDYDDDGVRDADDNCPDDANHRQTDGDEDGVGDVCDNCPEQINASQSDADNDDIGDACDVDDADEDGVPDASDNCPAVPNDGQADGDEDGIGDACDNCPDHPNHSQRDDDEDGIGDACESPDDDDGDGVPDADDNCPDAENPRQDDRDEDGRGDTCDNCPGVPNFSQADANGNGIGDACEFEARDADRDGVPDDDDNCPTVPNDDQRDPDIDGVGTACDNCPDASNRDQADEDGNGVGDICEAPPGDRDGDGVPDGRDNCPERANAGQNDPDRDGIGSACDNCPDDANPNQADGDDDGAGDACDVPDERIGIRITMAWGGRDSDADIHLLHPLGQWYDPQYDLNPTNPRPAWGLPGLTADARLPGDLEELSVDALAPGAYHVGVAYASVAGENEPVGVATPRVTIECGGERRSFGPQPLDSPNAIFEPADLWQVARITVPECEIEPFVGGQQMASTSCIFGNCILCLGCVAGICYGVDCPYSDCNYRTGECRDPCENVRCGDREACNPADRACYATGLGMCDLCEATVQCTAESTDACLRNSETDERFCSRPCSNARPCPNGYDCLALQDNQQDRYCSPELRTCIDRCEGVVCEGRLECDPVSGGCLEPRCDADADCGPGRFCGVQDGRCHDTGSGDVPHGGACRSLLDCEPGTVCVAFLNVCAQLCNDGQGCPPGNICLPDFTDGNRQLCVAPPP